MSTPSTFNQVKAAMAATFHFNGKSLEDVEADLSKLAEDKKKDEPKMKPGFGFVALPFTLANAGVNLAAVGTEGAAAGLAKLDGKMANDDKAVGAIRQRKAIIDNALAELKRKHPHL